MDDLWFSQNDKGYTRPTRRTRKLRKAATPAERLLRQHLRARQLGGARFNRQFPVGQFVHDFVCREHRLVIELDGTQHALAGDFDARRTQFLEAQGYRVIRFWNRAAADNAGWLLEPSEEALANTPSASHSRRRDGSLWIRSPHSGEF